MTSREEHERRRDRHRAEAKRLEFASAVRSALNLVLFVVAATVVAIGLRLRDAGWLGAGALAVGVFGVAYVSHGRIMRRIEREQTRAGIHERHLARIAGALDGLDGGDDLAPTDHVYASDLDLFGPRSMFARISVAQTENGRKTLASWLLEPAPRDAILERQRAVAELAAAVDLRAELEAAVLDTGRDRLDAAPFLAFVRAPRGLASHPASRLAGVVLPIATLGVFAASGTVLPELAWVPLALVQLGVAWVAERFVGPVHGQLASRARFVERYRALFDLVARQDFRAPLLVQCQERIRAGARELARLETWAALFDLRRQGLAHVFVNPLALWDLNVLGHVERWADRVGADCEAWFEAAGELEALCSLATLAHQDPDAISPTIVEDASSGLVAEGLVHPLIVPARRVANDVTLEGPGHALCVTGSNMAGKSTLLRAVGVSVVLALAGGPALARRFRLPVVRLRASMRVTDSLRDGSSYFQAELARLRLVVADASSPGAPPILFLLDELLRGTNANARHRGARSVLLHLLRRGAMGLVATHDVALAALEDELAREPRGLRLTNAHFTDVIEGETMRFDYRLRPGVVRTSNALRLLRLAGIDVEQDDGASSA